MGTGSVDIERISTSDSQCCVGFGGARNNSQPSVFLEWTVGDPRYCLIFVTAMNLERVMPARFPTYIIHNRFFITLDKLPENIDTSADVDVHNNLAASRAILQEILPEIQHLFTQEIDRLETQLQHCLEDKQLKQLLIDSYQLKLSQAEQKIADLQAMQADHTNKDLPEEQVVRPYMHSAMNSAPQANTNIKKQESTEERQFETAAMIELLKRENKFLRTQLKNAKVGTSATNGVTWLQFARRPTAAPKGSLCLNRAKKMPSPANKQFH